MAEARAEASLALSTTFLEQLQKMPQKIQKKILSFMDSFRADPKAATIISKPSRPLKTRECVPRGLAMTIALSS